MRRSFFEASGSFFEASGSFFGALRWACLLLAGSSAMASCVIINAYPDPESALACDNSIDCQELNNPCADYACVDLSCVTSTKAADGPIDEDERCQDWACTDGTLVRTANPDDVRNDTGCKSYACEGLDEIESVKQPGDACQLGALSGVCDDGLRCVVACTGQTAGECDDANDCTIDSCDTFNGACLYEFAGIGLSCVDATSPDAAVCDGVGACVTCNSLADCPPRSHECKTPVCAANVCSEVDAPNGTVAAVQVAEDCEQVLCMNGAYTDAIDPIDLPDDSNTCTDDTCNGSDEVFTPVSGRACGAGGVLVCNGAGECVGCNTASQCDPVAAFCLQASCGAGNVCEAIPDNEGLPLPPGQQANGNCNELLCNAGSTEQVIDTADVPADASQCKLGACSGGVPFQQPRSLGVACNENGGTVCDGNGSCVECTNGSQCTDPTAPNDCQGPVCTSMGVCAVGTDASDRPADTDCTKYRCQGPVLEVGHEPNATPCGVALRCDGIGNCIGCTSASQCADPGFCEGPACVSNVCGSKADLSDVPPDDGNQCTDETCSQGPPGQVNSPAGTACTQNGGAKCDGLGSCAP